MNGVQIFVEGDKKLREGFARLLADLRGNATKAGVEFRIFLAGDRHRTFLAFQAALEDDPESLNILLVDSEDPLHDGNDPWGHLARRQRDRWTKPADVANEQCQFMVETMECWFFADLDAIDTFFRYRRGSKNEFQSKSKNTDRIASQVARAELSRLAGERFRTGYNKITHGVPILERLDAGRLRTNAPSFKRLHDTISAALT